MKLKISYLLASFLVASSGCVVLNTFFPQDEFAFSHRIHVEDEGLECLDCHLDAEDLDEPGIPRLKQCNLCHEDIDADQPPERKMEVFYEDGKYLLTHPDGFQDEVIFSHVKHVGEYEENCMVCHVGIDANEEPSRIEPLRMAQCVSCHEDEGLAEDCTVCHNEVNREWSPRNHDLAWDRMHGDVSRSCPDQSSQDCTLCHSEQSCDICHQTEKPDSHGSYFRKRGHGIEAQIDRQNCATCHTPDYCDRCHEEAQPLNHSGTFGGTKSNHCVGCHFPIQGESCYTCHKAAPSHQLATPLPMNHSPGMNCRQCHGVDQPLPHADKGDLCIACHM